MKHTKIGNLGKEQMRHTFERLRALSDGINEVIYVSDPETYEVLFANLKTKEQFGKNIEGKKCHKVFRNLDKPCVSCTNRQIFGKNLGKTYIWDHRNAWNKRWYRGIAKAIKWPNGRLVRYGMAIDITDQKVTENALKRSEEKARLFAESARDLIYRYSLDKGLEYVNPAAEKITGYTPEEHYKDPNIWRSIVHPEDRPKIEKILKDFRKHRQPEKPIEMKWFHKNGTTVVTEQLIVPVYDDDGKLAAIEGIARDITERARMEKTLKESEAQYRTLFEESPISLWEYDMSEVKNNIDELRNTGVRDFRRYFDRNPKIVVRLADLVKVVAVNNTTLKLYRVKNKHELVRNLLENLDTDQFEVFKEELLAIAEARNTFEAETAAQTLTGERIHVAVKVSVAPGYEKTFSKVFASMIDITKQKKMEEAMKNSEEFYRSVVENSHDGTAIIDSNFKIIYTNGELANILDYQKEEIVGKDFREFLDKSCRSLVQDKCLLRLKGVETASQYMFRIVRKDGEVRDVEIKSGHVQDKHGKTYIIAQMLDITEHLKMEKERKRFEHRLSALNRYGQSLNTAKSLEEVYQVTLEAMEKTLGFEYASILRVEGKTLRVVRNRGYPRQLSLRLPLDGVKGITVRAATTGKPICVQDLRMEKTYITGKPGMLSELAVPVKEGNNVIGVLNVESDKLEGFDRDDRKLLEILASHTATAITNLNRQERLSALNEYGKHLNMARNLNEVYMLTLNAMEKTLGFEFATFFIIDDKNLRLVAHRGYPRKLNVALPLEGDEGVSLKVAKSGKPIFVQDIRKEKAYVQGRPGMLSELAVPIKIGEMVIGVLNVESERLAAFGKKDKELLEILASHAATAIGNLRKQTQLKTLSERLEHLMKNTSEIIQVKNMHERLRVITKAIGKFGWKRVVISLRDENLDGIDTVAAGLTKKEFKLLIKRKAPGQVWRERLGPKFEQFKIGEFYYLPWVDPWIRENVHGVPPEASADDATNYAGVPSKLEPEKMIDWHPQDMLYAPLRTPEGRIVGILSMDDPVDGRKPTRESLVPLELFLHQAAMIIENAQLIESLREARQQLEQKVDERTRELRVSQGQLLKAQRLAVIGELAGMVGHDLRNPLTSIAGATYYIKKRLVPDADVRIQEMLHLVEKNIAYSNKIINDLLDYSREIRLELTETTPKTIMKEALLLVEIPANIQLLDFTEDKPKMKTDIEKIKRCFVNVIKNAVDAMPEGGKLSLRSKCTSGSVKFMLSDTGMGMSEETIEKLWTPLFTTKAKGMGFGLPICKRVVEAHGGSIIAESTPKRGTTFTVNLPIEPETKEGGERIWIKMPESSLLTTTKT